MTRRSPLPLLLLFAACASNEIRREPAVETAARDAELRQEDERRRDFRAVLIRLDQGIDSYVQALANQGEFRADKQVERLEKLLRETVMDTGPMLVRQGQQAPPPGGTYLRLQAVAADASNPDHQGIALAALGFSGMHEVMPVILQGAQLSDPFVADRAVLGLAVLRAPATPPGVIAAIVDRADHPEEGRVQAAWALQRLLPTSERAVEIVAHLRRWVGDQRDRVPAGVLVQAARGLGLTQDPLHADAVVPLLRHPTPRVRMAAALALGRMNAQAHWQDLLQLLAPAETSTNVRLHARKALAALAGGTDYGYDVAAWRKAFDRGSR